MDYPWAIVKNWTKGSSMWPVSSSGSWRNKQKAEGNQGLYLQAVCAPRLFDVNLMCFISHVSYVWVNSAGANLAQIFTLGKSSWFFTKVVACSLVCNVVATASWSSARCMLKRDVLIVSITAFRVKHGETTTIPFINRHTIGIGAPLCMVCVAKYTNIHEPRKSVQIHENDNMHWKWPMLI